MFEKMSVCMAEADSGEGGGAGGSGVADVGQGQAISIPERFQVLTAGGDLDIDASSLKLAEAYRTLEKRVGTGDMRPNSPEEYTIPVPEEMRELFDPKTDPLLGDFLKKAHEVGMTQGQVDFTLGQYFEVAPLLVGGSQQLSFEECHAELSKEWKTAEQYDAGMELAYKAARAYGGNDAEAIIKQYDSDPVMIRFLARAGAELGEDTSFGSGYSTRGGESIGSLMQSEAYSNAKHPDHARVSAQVQAYHIANTRDSRSL